MQKTPFENEIAVLPGWHFLRSRANERLAEIREEQAQVRAQGAPTAAPMQRLRDLGMPTGLERCRVRKRRRGPFDARIVIVVLGD